MVMGIATIPMPLTLALAVADLRFGVLLGSCVLCKDSQERIISVCSVALDLSFRRLSAVCGGAAKIVGTSMH